MIDLGQVRRTVCGGASRSCLVLVPCVSDFPPQYTISLYHHALFSLPPVPVIPSRQKNVHIYFIMPLTGQATSSSSNVQLIIRALADYSKETGIDLSSNPFATALERSNSPEAILQLLQQREKAFKEYRDVNRRLINFLDPAVKVLQAFSGILGEAVSLVSCIFRLIDKAFHMTSSGPLPPSKGVVRWDRCTP